MIRGVDNFDIVKKYLTYKPGYAYNVDIVCRFKDSHLRIPTEFTRKSIQKEDFYRVWTGFVASEQELRNSSRFIKTLCDGLGARAYITLIPTNLKDLSAFFCTTIQQKLSDSEKNCEDFLMRLQNQMGYMTISNGLEKYLDNDSRIVSFDLDYEEYFSSLCRDLDTLGIEDLCKIPSVSGMTVVGKLPENFQMSFREFNLWWNKNYYENDKTHRCPRAIEWCSVNLYVPEKRKYGQ